MVWLDIQWHEIEIMRTQLSDVPLLFDDLISIEDHTYFASIPHILDSENAELDARKS